MFVPRDIARPPEQVLQALALRRAGRSIPAIAGGRYHIWVARREADALLDEHVGPKS